MYVCMCIDSISNYLQPSLLFVMSRKYLPMSTCMHFLESTSPAFDHLTFSCLTVSRLVKSSTHSLTPSLPPSLTPSLSHSRPLLVCLCACARANSSSFSTYGISYLSLCPSVVTSPSSHCLLRLLLRPPHNVRNPHTAFPILIFDIFTRHAFLV